jgi:hypothetical protein
MASGSFGYLAEKSPSLSSGFFIAYEIQSKSVRLPGSQSAWQ